MLKVANETGGGLRRQKDLTTEKWTLLGERHDNKYSLPRTRFLTHRLEGSAESVVD